MKLGKDYSFEVINEYIDQLLNQKLIDVQDFLNISLVSIDLVDKLSQTKVDQSNSGTAIDRNGTLTDPESLSDNDVSQVTRKTTNDTLALYKRMISILKSFVLYLREHVKSRNTHFSKEI